MSNPLTIAAVSALPTDSWVNDGVVATVRSVERKVSKANKPFWKCYLADPTGTAQVSATFFTAPKFIQGQRVQFTGAGIKFKNDQYGPSLSVGDKAVTEILGEQPASRQEQPNAHPQSPATSPIGPIHGASVGGGIARAVEVLLATRPDVFKTDSWRNDVYSLAVGFCDIQQAIENGKPLEDPDQVPY